MRPAVFLDRDGTMVHDAGYLSRIDELRWYPWTIDAVRLLNRAGFLVCVTSNQGGIGLGLFPESFVAEVHHHMAATLAASGATIDGWFYCPHHPSSVLPQFRVDCDCRKPKPGMIHQAAARFPIDLTRSFVVGDRAPDVGLARNANLQSVIVRTGGGAAEIVRTGAHAIGADHIAEDLMGATAWILEQSGFPRVTA